MTVISTGWLAAGRQGAGSSKSSPGLKIRLPSIRYFLKALENSLADGSFPYFLLCLKE